MQMHSGELGSVLGLVWINLVERAAQGAWAFCGLVPAASCPVPCLSPLKS